MKKENRVKKGSEIEMIMKNRQSTGNRFFVVYKKENHENKHFRAAISVSKKFGNAVKRNKVKRQVRAVVSNLDVSPKNDLFIVIKNNANTLKFEEIENHVTKLIKKQNILR